ncbi:FAD-dependent oxidoreductase [Nostoc sp. DedSLP04]|uniref:FAD-dependent oxidoreductase n=1 Tax=Nostoc sp. DedSLP04 TaxID=3075401 RepID=UPI002AD4AD8C|nr:NAD(P)-binding protein [Nostoc sp. DedSLP04]MDZ8035952.1 NAD(P)-binding protein [Nostoc sp. DedSLP04]
MVSSNSKIGIIGAGTSGAYLASLLIQEGFQVDLFEKAPVVRTDGCGILIVQSGMEALSNFNSEPIAAVGGISLNANPIYSNPI